MYYKYDYFRYDRKGVAIRICRETCPGCCIFVPATKTVDTYRTVNQLLTTNCHISTNKTKFNPKWSKMCFCKYSTVVLNILKNFSHNFQTDMVKQNYQSNHHQCFSTYIKGESQRRYPDTGKCIQYTVCSMTAIANHNVKTIKLFPFIVSFFAI